MGRDGTEVLGRKVWIDASGELLCYLPTVQESFSSARDERHDVRNLLEERPPSNMLTS